MIYGYTDTQMNYMNLTLRKKKLDTEAQSAYLHLSQVQKSAKSPACCERSAHWLLGVTSCLVCLSLRGFLATLDDQH